MSSGVDATGHRFAEAPSSDRILQLGFSFRNAKVLLSAVELGVFEALGEEPRESGSLARKLGLHGRGAEDFFDALVALGLLKRDGHGRYHNASDCACFLDPRQPDYIGDVLEYLNASIYGTWSRLTDALRSGAPQGGPSAGGGYQTFYGDSTKLQNFLRGMTAGSRMPAKALAETFPWQRYQTFVDIGTAEGAVPVEIARRHPHLSGTGVDLPAVGPMFTRYVATHGLADRLKFQGGDFFSDSLPPQADVLIMGRILHNWDLPTRRLLLARAHAALPRGGAIVIFETLIDDERRCRTHSLLASLNMLLQTGGGSEFTATECGCWLLEAGFSDVTLSALGSFYTAVIARK